MTLLYNIYPNAKKYRYEQLHSFIMVNKTGRCKYFRLTDGYAKLVDLWVGYVIGNYFDIFWDICLK